ncbi:MAG: hypothetical protein IJ686_00645 [Bacteroidales bacterium]|nr:hypothetical protein [Bacteroidales bacterium]
MRSRIILLIIVLALPFSAQGGVWSPEEWPVLKHYDSAHLQQVALPLGGIGTGTVSLGGRGELRDWEIMNVPAKGYSSIRTGNDAPFFAIYTRGKGQSMTKMLAGPLYAGEYLHYDGNPVSHHGLPRFRHASFDAAYPFGQVNLRDPEMPVSVRIKGFNPLIPGDSNASGLPIAVLCYEVSNESEEELEIAVCGVIRNFVGRDGQSYRENWRGDRVPTGAAKNCNRFCEGDGIHGVYYYSEGVSPADKAWGNFCLATDSDCEISYRTYSTRKKWSNSILNFWDDFSDDGIISNPVPSETRKIGGEDDPMGALSVKAVLGPGEKRCFNFYLTWNFPNRFAWSKEVVGNYYSTLYPDSWESALALIPQVPELERKTLLFVDAFLSSSFPDPVKEAALFNLSVLRSQTVFRIADGHMFGWEGVMDHYGSCPGSCTHVWNYEQATAFLFGDLARSMRDVEFNYALSDDGGMDFRANLPLGLAPDKNEVAADGQMGCIMKLYREWQLCGSNSFLASYWPACRKAMEYVWKEDGWDGDCDGVMEGAQHNTMDVFYYGPNPQMGFWYLGALRAAEEMAVAMKDKVFARKCRNLFNNGRAWIESRLFNGEYYEQIIADPQTREFLPEDSDKIPPYQLGKGCLVDQLVGQYMAHVCNLGYLGNPEYMRTTLRSIMKYNYVERVGAVFNNMRSYVIGDESALLMASWPHGRLEVPFPYFSEAMTGFEYCAAVGMMYEGMTEDGIKCFEFIRDRFDGLRRNPFDEPECGHHYARSMTSWAAVLALSGFHYSGVNKTMSFTAAPGRYFWSNGYAFGLCEVSDSQVTLSVLKGSLELKALSLAGYKKPVASGISLLEGESKTIEIKHK